MDGIRAYWNGATFISKQSKELEHPSWFSDGLPTSIHLDGELWLGRGKMENLLSALKSDKPDWSDIKYMVFDMPSSNLPFESRMDEMKKIEFPNHVVLVEKKRCLGNDHLLQVLYDTVKQQGEGLMLSKPQSFYVKQRTNVLLKVKVRISVCNLT